ncbi:MAG: riboflavin synthase [Acidimicrobiia bacterium]|nr:riboflavin synthase [Acidimicrobiia bacterium]NNF69980.1 riboflavin synthase [Acidimicrobiia bacterium]NNK91228.1 riboflavin synthase [Acidimicrobiia bacterium]
MFTGIVEAKATISAIDVDNDTARLTLKTGDITDGLAVGDSVAVAGTCLTVVALEADSLSVDVITETLRRTALGSYQAGDGVNVERAMAASGRFDGHIVQGHVDGTGTVISVKDEPGQRTVRVAVPDSLMGYVVEKGSITLDGVSLTVAAVGPDWLEVALIPHTLEVTTLGTNETGDLINIEVDILAKYVERLMRRQP